MAELNPCWALENRTDHHANVNRVFMGMLSSRAEGVRSSADLAVTQRGAGANMSVDVAKGACTVFGDESEFQGMYGCVNDATVNVAIAAADATNARRDLIVARVRDDFYSGATKAWALTVIQGTPAGSPADPTVASNCLTLARVAVAAGATSITNANITDLRPLVPVGIIPGNSARPPGTLYGAFSQEPAFKPTPRDGQFRYDTDTGRLYVYSDHAGGAWVCITPVTASTDTDETRASATYGDLSGGATGPSVSIQTGAFALVTIAATGFHATPNHLRTSFGITGATTSAASDAWGAFETPASGTAYANLSRTVVWAGLTPGVNVFTMKYRTDSGTGHWLNRSLTVVGLP